MDMNLDILRIAHEKASYAVARQTVVATNIANADTPGFKAMDLRPFAKVYAASETGFVPRATRAAHFTAESGPRSSRLGANNTLIQTSDTVSPNGNSVSLEQEMIKAAELRQDYDMALSIYRKSMDILKASIGR